MVSLAIHQMKESEMMYKKAYLTTTLPIPGTDRQAERWDKYIR